MTPCVILAGGQAKPDLQALIGQTNRALAVVRGKSLLRHVVDAVRAAQPGTEHAPSAVGVGAVQPGTTSEITVIGDLPDSPDYARLPDSGDFVTNLFAGLTAYGKAPLVLIATADLPFLTAPTVAAFVGQATDLASESGAGVIYPVVPVAACYARFPGIRRTALRLREGEYTGGNLALVRPEFLLTHRDRIAAAFAARKSPFRLAVMLGFGTLGRLVASQKLAPRLLSIPFLEARVSRLLGGPARALICDLPELATDLDRPADFAAVEAMHRDAGVGR
jgi:GTP:adenosylcobinamide-phosphate guanylyltransferase